MFCKLARGFREKKYIYFFREWRKKASFGCCREIRGELEGEGDSFGESLRVNQ